MTSSVSCASAASRAATLPERRAPQQIGGHRAHRAPAGAALAAVHAGEQIADARLDQGNIVAQRQQFTVTQHLAQPLKEPQRYDL